MRKIRSKRVLASLLVIFMCISLLLTACGQTDAPIGGDSLSVDTALTDSSVEQNGSDSIKPPSVDVTEKWRGQTLNILVSTWDGELWSQAELAVDYENSDSTAGYGEIVNNAVILRNRQIEEKYGVTVNWINARSSQIQTLLMEAGAAGNQKYHIAMPRAAEAQSLVEKGLVYDLAKSEYINLNKSYYSQAATEAYTVNEITLFVAGDFSFVDEASAYVTFYNTAMLEGIDGTPEDFYTLVKEGKWTVEALEHYASLFQKNTGSPAWTDDDFYGFGTQGMVQFYGYAGVKQVSVENKQYKLFEAHPYLNDTVDSILEIKGESWSRTKWEMNPIDAFKEGRVAFYNGRLGEIKQFGEQRDAFGVGILPSPLIGEGQTEHYTLAGKEAVLACVPKSTQDREMSEAFVEILAMTGQELISPAYLENIKAHLDPAVAEQSIEVLTDRIFNGIIYDQGYINDTFTEAFELKHAGYSGIMPDYTHLIEAATETIDSWNKNWIDYEE